ncbi:MAG: serine hydrolase domain-containing protein [Ginsengibacter sp.]
MQLLKNLLLFSVISFYFIACSTSSGDKSRHSNVDSSFYKAQKPGAVDPEKFLDYYNTVLAFYNTVLEPSGFNGGLLVAKNGSVIFEKYTGFSNIEKKEVINEHSAFHLASVTKTFTAMAVLKLVEENRINLDDDVFKYFPGFPYSGITVRMLLNHRSGLPNYTYFLQELGWDVKKTSTNYDVLQYLVQYKPPLTHPIGKHFSYCNTNFALLALIIEKVSGKTYSNFLSETFFKPLQMTDSYVFNMSDSAKAMPSYDFRGRREPLNFLDGEYGDKNIYSTPRDLLKWDQALYSGQLFKKETLDEAFAPYSNEKPGIKNYGLGWRMNIYPNGKKMIFHTGWWHGNNTFLIRLPEDSATIIILGNKYNRTIYQAKNLINIFQHYFATSDDTDDENPKELPLKNQQNDSILTNQKLDSLRKK